VVQPSLGSNRYILYISCTAHGPCAARRPMHAAGIEFDHAFFIRQTAKAHAVIFGIVFGTLHHSERRVECVSTAAEELVRVPEIVVTIPGSNDERAFAGCLGGG